VDYLSLHQYYGNRDDDTADFLACNVGMDKFISSVVAICDCVKAKKRSDKQINLSFDEWNVWYHSNEADEKLEKWVKAPHQLEDVYNFEDALLVGSMLITLLRHADRVKIACMAQLVNVIAPIMTSDTGAWRQTIFYPYMYASVFGNGTTLKANVDSKSYKSNEGYDVPYLCTSVIHNSEKNEVVVFAVNRSLTDDIELSLEGFEEFTLNKHIMLYNDDLSATNTVNEEKVSPVEIQDDASSVSLKKHSWNMLVFKK
jgi:alpha-N-arabinofuranosidase